LPPKNEQSGSGRRKVKREQGTGCLFFKEQGRREQGWRWAYLQKRVFPGGKWDSLREESYGGVYPQSGKRGVTKGEGLPKGGEKSPDSVKILMVASKIPKSEVKEESSPKKGNATTGRESQWKGTY